MSNPNISAAAVGRMLLLELDNDIRASFERHALLDDSGECRLHKAAEKMWANLPEKYHWLKDWERV